MRVAMNQLARSQIAIGTPARGHDRRADMACVCVIAVSEAALPFLKRPRCVHEAPKHSRPVDGWCVIGKAKSVWQKRNFWRPHGVCDGCVGGFGFGCDGHWPFGQMWWGLRSKRVFMSPNLLHGAGVTRTASFLLVEAAPQPSSTTVPYSLKTSSYT